MRNFVKLFELTICLVFSGVIMMSVSACDMSPITVIKDGDNAYIYNGTRYVFKPQLHNYEVDIFKDSTEIGYAYALFGAKYMVYVADCDKEQDIIFFKANNSFKDIFVKESVVWSDILDCEVKSIKYFCEGPTRRLNREFKWRDVVSGEGISNALIQNNSTMLDIKCDLIKYDHVLIDTHCLFYEDKIYFSVSENYGDDFYYYNYEITDKEIIEFIMPYFQNT